LEYNKLRDLTGLVLLAALVYAVLGVEGWNLRDSALRSSSELCLAAFLFA
jgi:hypothetical protein